jgi:hypothetical protein
VHFRPYTIQVNLFDMHSGFAPFRQSMLRRAVLAMRLTTASLSHAIYGQILIFLLGIPAPILPFRRRRLKAKGGAGDVVRHSTDPKQISVISAYATRRVASDALAPSGADTVDGRPRLDGEGLPR